MPVLDSPFFFSPVMVLLLDQSDGLLCSRDLELEVNEDDIEELIMGHEDELTTEELREILNEETKKHSEMCLLLK
ncbi:hypothetical protein TNCV_1571821 [Trichonephila clavipes]|uniref:Uncharacterized protein n=1 Tax=Trichonephila clavipes TaxID=2585209 RepID=A0A8X6SKZ9_TRICX|nr:hypothetical protein TNCV_1571821 [Trichonephila clavipes]